MPQNAKKKLSGLFSVAILRKSSSYVTSYQDALVLIAFLGDRLQNGSPYAIIPSSVCPVLSVCLSVTLVYCGQTVGFIKMKLGMQVGLGRPGHAVLDGDPAPFPQRGTAPPNFRPVSVAAKWLHGSRCHLVWS